MTQWQQVLIRPETAILKAIQIIDASSMQAVVVVDEKRRLTGIVTDGDVRRGILKGHSVEEAVSAIMNKHPQFARATDGWEMILALMKAQRLRQIPVVDADGVVVDVKLLDDLIAPEEKENWVVLMAGGFGKRLYPLTKSCPKPLLKIGDKPILETIICNFMEHGFKKFYITVNFKAELVKEYFGDGTRYGARFEYIHENKPMGTAGSIGLLPIVPKHPIIVMNGDLLTKLNFQHLLDFHQSRKVEATMCVREYDFKVPYGVVCIENDAIKSIDEKPVQKFFVNAGIYVLEPSALKHIPVGHYLDMPSLFDRILSVNLKTTAFPIREYWSDIGHIDDYHRTNGEFAQVFYK